MSLVTTSVELATVRLPKSDRWRRDDTLLTALRIPKDIELPHAEINNGKKTAPGDDANPLERPISLSGDPDWALKLYLKDIGAIPLITREREIVLAERIKTGDKKAFNELYTANLRLVVRIAHGYENCGLSLLDLIGEGNEGLRKAVAKFNPSKGAKFSTYSAFWIKQAIKRGLADFGRTIRLPVHVVDAVYNVRRASAKLEEQLGREPSHKEIADDLNARQYKITEKKVAKILSIKMPVNLDQRIGADGDESSTLGEVIPDEHQLTAYEDIAKKERIQILKSALPALDGRERAIIISRFGLDGEKIKTLDEVGQKMGVTRERIRQIQNIAMKKLRKYIGTIGDPE